MKNKINTLKKLKFTLLSLAMSTSVCGCMDDKIITTQDTTQSTTIETTFENITTTHNPENTIAEYTTEYITTQDVTTQSTTEQITKERKEPTIEITEKSTIKIEEITTEELTSENTTEEITTEGAKNNDEIVLDEIRDNKEEIKQYAENEQIDLVSQKGKEYFIKFVDFIFYDGEISGVKWNDILDNSKELLYDELCDLDTFIMTFVPDYKEKLADKYKDVKDFVKKGYFYTLDKVKGFIGEERYDKIGEYKDKIIDKASDITDKAKEKTREYKLELKEWYEELKEN